MARYLVVAHRTAKSPELAAKLKADFKFDFMSVLPSSAT